MGDRRRTMGLPWESIVYRRSPAVGLFGRANIARAAARCQPLAEMGRMAVSLLVRLLEKRRVDGLGIELQTRLVLRDSTAAPGGLTDTRTK